MQNVILKNYPNPLQFYVQLKPIYSRQYIKKENKKYLQNETEVQQIF